MKCFLTSYWKDSFPLSSASYEEESQLPPTSSFENADDTLNETIYSWQHNEPILSVTKLDSPLISNVPSSSEGNNNKSTINIFQVWWFIQLLSKFKLFLLPELEKSCGSVFKD